MKEIINKLSFWISFILINLSCTSGSSPAHNQNSTNCIKYRFISQSLVGDSTVEFGLVYDEYISFKDVLIKFNLSKSFSSKFTIENEDIITSNITPVIDTNSVLVVDASSKIYLVFDSFNKKAIQLYGGNYDDSVGRNSKTPEITSRYDIPLDHFEKNVRDTMIENVSFRYMMAKSNGVEDSPTAYWLYNKVGVLLSPFSLNNLSSSYFERGFCGWILYWENRNEYYRIMATDFKECNAKEKTICEVLRNRTKEFVDKNKKS